MTISDPAEDLTVLIANLGGVDRLRACLRSLYETCGHVTSISVVIGFNFAGGDEAPDAIAAEFPHALLLRAPLKLGYCHAYNELLKRSTGRYSLLLDDDTVLPSGTIDHMVQFMDANPGIGISGCRTVNPDGSYQKTTARMYSLGTEAINAIRPAAFWRDGIGPNTSGWYPAGWLNGHFLLVRAQVIKDVGVLDEAFYTFQCEADWCLRIRRAGWQVAYVADAEIMHVGGDHSVATKVKSERNLLRSHINRYYFIRKHYGSASLHLFRPIMSVGAALRLLTYVSVGLAIPGRRPEAVPKIRAYWQIMLRGVARNPDRPPASLRSDHADAVTFQPYAPSYMAPALSAASR